MPKPRVHEIARRVGVTSKELLAWLGNQGLYVRGPSSVVEPCVVDKIIREFSSLSKSVRPGAPPVSDEKKSAETRGMPSLKPAPNPFAPAPEQYSSWRAGAVPIPTHPDLLGRIGDLRRRFPAFGYHLEAFRALGSQVVHVRSVQQEGFRDCLVAHVRFSQAIETGFGFTREVMIFYSPHEDLQARTFAAAVHEAGASGRSATPDIFFLWSPDPRLRVKLGDWSRAWKLGIPLLVDEADQLSLIRLLRDYVYSRDLFNQTTPVQGAAFFGRRTLMQALRGDVLKQHVIGLFGLRKSGKTSILLQLRAELRDDNVVATLIDLEAYPSPPEDPTDALVADIRRRLTSELTKGRVRTRELDALPESPGILEFRNALHELLRKIEPGGHRIVLMLDEIEYLTPSDRIDIAEGDMPRVAQLIGALRSVVQESSNFTFVLAGLTSGIIESGRLYGRPNPLFSWARPVYVRPFDREEADSLATTVGAKMGVQIDTGALEALHQASGGHAYLYRNLASRVVEQLSQDDFQRRMTRAHVLGELVDWRSRIQGNIEEMVDHVSRYYPHESLLLELLREDQAGFGELAAQERVAVRRLVDLGLIHKEADEYRPSVLLELL